MNKFDLFYSSREHYSIYKKCLDFVLLVYKASLWNFILGYLIKFLMYKGIKCSQILLVTVGPETMEVSNHRPKF